LHRFALSALGVLALLAGLLVPNAPATADSRAAPVAASAAPLSGTFIVGDSTLFQVAPLLRELRPDWYVDHQRGRPVSALKRRVAAYLRTNPNPANFVMALGTNRTHDPDWSAARLRRAIAQLPAETNVFMVMVVRAGSYQRWKDVTLRLYNRWARDLARSRPHTYVVDWRQTVLADPTLDPVTGESSLLVDGTHQTGDTHGQKRGPGVETWVDLVLDKFDEVAGLARVGA
jgi:hypothetical protein